MRVVDWIRNSADSQKPHLAHTLWQRYPNVIECVSGYVVAVSVSHIVSDGILFVHFIRAFYIEDGPRNPFNKIKKQYSVQCLPLSLLNSFDED